MSKDLRILPVNNNNDLGFTEGGDTVSAETQVAQKFTTCLLAQLGSVLHTPDFGSDLVYDARLSILRNEAQLQLAFAVAVTNLLDYQSSVLEELGSDVTIPANELFQTAELLDFSYDENKLILEITVTTQIKETVDMQLPIIVTEL